MQGRESNKGKERVLRVLIAHGASTVRQQLKGAVEELGYVQVVGEVANGSEALQRTIELRPDVIILAEDAPDLRVGRLTRRIKAKQPKAKILIPKDGGLTRDEALAAGVDGFFELSDGHRGLCDILHKLYARMQYPGLSCALLS